MTRALDVACGTGMSTEALLPISRWVVGIDLSESMLAQAAPGPVYVRGRAEKLPFDERAFDLLTVALGLHWFDRSTFLREAHRVIAARGWLLIYDSGFCQKLEGCAAFARWVQEYRLRFPPPARNMASLTDDGARGAGFEIVASEPLRHRWQLDLEQLIGYLHTQSRVLRTVRDGRTTADEASAWLRETLRPMLGATPGTFEFDGTLQLLRAR